MARGLLPRLLLLAAFFGCAGPAGRPLEELVLRDSLYLEPGTMEPYSGPVFRMFSADEGGRVQLQATLRDGMLAGEVTVYHSTGRIRLQGETRRGVKCGGWVENERPGVPESAYEALKEELESLVIYPSCSSLASRNGTV